MRTRRQFNYLWNEYLEPHLIFLPLLPFIIPGGILNRLLRKLPDPVLPTVRLGLRTVFAFLMAASLAIALLSAMAYFDWIQFGLLLGVPRPLVTLLSVWLAGGMYVLFCVAGAGRRQPASSEE